MKKIRNALAVTYSLMQPVKPTSASSSFNFRVHNRSRTRKSSGFVGLPKCCHSGYIPMFARLMLRG